MKPQSGLVVICALASGCVGGDVGNPPDPYELEVPPLVDDLGEYPASLLPGLEEPSMFEVPVPGTGETVAVQPALSWDASGRLAVTWRGPDGDGSSYFGGLFAPVEPLAPLVAPSQLAPRSSSSDGRHGLCHVDGLGFVLATDRHHTVRPDFGAPELANFIFTPFQPAAPSEPVRVPDGTRFVVEAIDCGSGDFAVAGMLAVPDLYWDVFIQRHRADGALDGGFITGLSTERRTRMDPVLALAPDGDLHVAFTQSVAFENDTSVVLARLDPSGALISSEAMDDLLPPPARSPAIGAVDAGVLLSASRGGHLYFVWRDDEGLTVTVPNPDGTDVATGNVAIAPVEDGRLAVVWRRTTPDDLHEIRFAMFERGAFVGEPRTIAEGPVRHPAVAVREGRLAIAYTVRGSGDYRVKVVVARVPERPLDR